MLREAVGAVLRHADPVPPAVARHEEDGRRQGTRCETEHGKDDCDESALHMTNGLDPWFPDEK